MSNLERAGLIVTLHKVKAELGVINSMCQRERLLGLAMHIEKMLSECNDALEYFAPETPDYIKRK
jgi:hypothetical protein